MLLKICYQCGAKVQKLYDGICSSCIKENIPPIREIKPLNIKFCNSCGKIHLGNQLISVEKLEELLPLKVSKNLVLNPQYKLKNLNIKDFEIEGNKLSFDIEIDCDLKS